MPLHFTAFHPDYKMLDIPPTPPETLSRARRIAIGEGLRFVYTGNVHDPDGGTTTCPGCGAAVVIRDWYSMRHYALTDDGRCRACGTQLPGVLRRSRRALGRTTASRAYRVNDAPACQYASILLWSKIRLVHCPYQARLLT